MTVLLGNGDGTFPFKLTYSVGNGPDHVAVGDFNGDGHLDLAVTNYSDNTVVVLLGNGNGTFTSQVTYPVGNSPTSVAVGDFNGDSKPDLAVANGYDATVSILLGNGDGTFTSNTVHVTGQNFSATAGTPFSGTVASVIGAEQASDLSATIDWGDGSPTSSGTVSGSDPYSISGTHTYTTQGSYTVTITVSDSNLNSTSTGTATATVTPTSGLTLSGQPVSATEGRAFHGEVASGTYAGSGTLSATIDWGDGSPTSHGTITGTGGTFTVSGKHTYAEEGSYTISIAVSDGNGQNATTNSTATVSDASLKLTRSASEQ